MKHPLIEQFEQAQLKPDLPEFAPGDTVSVHVQIQSEAERLQAIADAEKAAQDPKKGGKSKSQQQRRRTQVFTGVVIAHKGGGLQTSFVVRKISHNVGVERTFNLHSNLIDKIEVVRRGDVRKAKLYYLRGLSAKKARIKEKFDNKAAAKAKVNA